MGWNVKHPTKWVSYRLLHKTFQVSFALEGWLKWFRGFSIFFGWKVRGFVRLLGGGSKMVFWGCACHSEIMPWAPWEKSSYREAKVKPLSNSTDRRWSLWQWTLGSCWITAEKVKPWGRLLPAWGLRKRPCILTGDAEQLMVRATRFLAHTGESLCNPIHSLCCVCK